MAATYTLISSNVLTSTAASVTFSSIPATYTDLVLRFSVRDNSTYNYTGNALRINGLSTTVYSYTDLTGTGSAAASSRLANNDQIYGLVGTAANATANTFGNSEIYIPNYAGTAKKAISGFGVSENNATASYIDALAGLLNDTNAITSLTIYPAFAGSSFNFVAGSSFYLYGIKNA